MTRRDIDTACSVSERSVIWRLWVQATRTRRRGAAGRGGARRGAPKLTCHATPSIAFTDTYYLCGARPIRLAGAVSQESEKTPSPSNLVTFFFEFCVGNASAFKYGGPCARSGQFSGIANINLSQQNVTWFEKTLDLYGRQNKRPPPATTVKSVCCSCLHKLGGRWLADA